MSGVYLMLRLCDFASRRRFRSSLSRVVTLYIIIICCMLLCMFDLSDDVVIVIVDVFFEFINVFV